MASLHKDPRNKSPYWYAAYTTSTGKRMFKSTKCKTHRDALQVALNLERAEQDASTGRLTESRIRDLLTDTLERIGGKPVQQKTMRCWFATPASGGLRWPVYTERLTSCCATATWNLVVFDLQTTRVQEIHQISGSTNFNHRD